MGKTSNFGFLFDFFHHRKPTVCAGSDHKPLTFPGNVLFHRQGRVANCPVSSGALLRGDDGERGPALLDILAAAMRASHVAFLIVDESQDLRKGFLAGVAEELVVGHTDLPQSFVEDDY